jgi:hypothetical protein
MANDQTVAIPESGAEKQIRSPRLEVSDMDEDTQDRRG